MIDNMLIYLCGAMSSYYEANRYKDAIEWRSYVKGYFGVTNIKIFDPTHNSLEHFKFSEECQRGVIYQNYTYLKKSDLLLVNLEMLEDSIGSVWEMSLAWANHIPIIAFGKCKKWEKRPHFKSMVTVQFHTVQEACDYIMSMFNHNI